MARSLFFGLGVLCILLAAAGFGPNLYRSFNGQLHFPLAVYAHAVIMVGWLVVYTVQAGLAARGDLSRHRQLGWAALALAAAVWISMGVATIEALLRYDPDEFGFITKPLLIQLGSVTMFPMFVAWAVYARRHAAWHKRLMTFATIVLIQAALDRMHWLPNEGLPMFWHAGLRAYVLLILPLIVFDLATLRRIHPATLAGTGILVAVHAVVSFYWNDAAWDQAARGFWIWLRASGG